MTPEAIRDVYNQGPDAVIELVTSLLSAITQLQQQHDQLLARVQALEAQLAKDSHNSGKPPGAQKGHPGSSLCWSQTPNHVINHRPGQ